MMLIGRKRRCISILFLVILMLFECISQIPVFADVSSGDIIAYYNLDGNANDSSGHGYNGTLAGNVTFTTGFTGQAASLDGNSYIRLPDNLIRGRQNQGFTISLRFKTSSSGTILGYQNVAPLEAGIGEYVPIIYVGNDGLLHCEFWVYDPSVLPNRGYGLKVPSSSRVDNDQWHSITLTATTTSIEVYMDNVCLGSDTVTNGKYIAHLSMSYNQIGLGFNDTGRPGSSTTGWKYYTGLIDDLYILNKGISQQEVQQLTSDAPNSANINIINNPTGADDTITVTQLSEGDVVKVYDAPTGGNVLTTATVASGQTSIVIPVAQLGTGTGSVYISVTKSGSNESARTQKVFVSETTQAANTSIAVAKSLLPATITPTEGTHTNLLTYLNALNGMAGTGVTLTLESNNSAIAGDGTITYGPSPVIGNVVVHINKADGTEDTRTSSVTVPAHVQPSANLVSYYDFAGNLADSKGNSSLTAFTAGGDGIHNNASSSFGTDSQSITDNTYWQWNSTAPRGGGFRIDVNNTSMNNYSIGLRFSYNETNPGYKKIIDYKNMQSDNGFYFYGGGKLKFYPNDTMGNSTIANGQIVDLIITRNGTTNEFTAYMVSNNQFVQEFSITDAGGNATPAVVSGKSRLGFFFDENISNGAEATSGGKVYSIKIWDGPITQQEATTAMDTGNTTVLANGSLGAPGNGTITELAAGTAYQVVVDGVTKYIKADGTLSDSEIDTAPLAGTQIAGLSNGMTYRVQQYTPTSGSSFETAINNISGTANAADMKTVLETDADILSINVTNPSDYYNLSQQGKAAVSQALFAGKPYNTVAAIKSAFNSAVTVQKSTELGGSANASIAAAKALIPITFTATEGSTTNILSYLNNIIGMAGTGVTLSIVSSNTNVSGDGTITYTSSSVTGNIVVTISKANGTSDTKTISVTIPAHSSPGSNTSTGTASNPITGNTNIVINGESTDAATSDTQKDNNGRLTTTVSIDDKKINEVLEKIPPVSSTGTGETSSQQPVIQIPVKAQSDVIVGQLNGQTVKNMEAKNAVLEIKTDEVTYTLPALQINIDAVSSQIGTQVELKDIKVKVAISKSSGDTVKIVEDTANKNHYQVVVKPVEFEIQCTSGSKTVEVSQFNGYVERTVAIPDGVDPGRITTGIVLNADGSFSHVPTKITMINGKYFTKINSVTNSTYSVIWNPVVFKDVENHWVKEAANDMGSRLIINGTDDDRFEPDRSMTREEFIEIVVRALGLKPQTGNSLFKDVNSDNIYSGYIQTAHKYKLISGCPDGNFDPTAKITREQAMIIIARAMSLAGLNPVLASGEANSLIKGFKDCRYISGYAEDSIAACIKIGIIAGINNKELAPGENLTRAETAQIVRQLLVKSGLI